ncbi:MAG: DNA primase, partial [Actinomycetota bacterium]|nr:DNA primase [Actinomycetota bacterium]
MARYPEEAKEQVRDAVDFAELVGTRTALSPAGAGGRLEACCVFHEERTPSLSIDPVQKLYHCFGCGVGGDVFQWVADTEGLDFRGSMEFLADRYGVPLERFVENPAAAAARKQTERLHELLDRTAAFYERFLWQSSEAAPAREYLAARGLQEPALRAYRVGFAPTGSDVVLKASRAAGFSAVECDAAGLSQRVRSGATIDRFRGRIMFPLADRRGRVVGFGARALGDQAKPKYLNSSDSRLFTKGRQLYGAHVARAAAAKQQSVVLVEGYTDVIALHQAGVRNVVGSMGTAVTEHQVTELVRLAATVKLALDADAAGEQAVLRTAKVAAGRPLTLRVIAMPEGQDPADVAAGPAGAAAIAELVADSVPLVSFR